MEIILLCIDIALTAAVLAAVLRKPAAVPEPVRKDEKKPEEAAQKTPDYLDEGFENIMRFSVNGKTGFELGE